MSVAPRSSQQPGTKSIQARITWLSVAQGGRRQLPTVSTYRSVARFDDDPNRILGSWDVELRFNAPPVAGTDAVATVRFSSNDAPRHLLRPGGTFELTEGRKVVARGEIVGAKQKAHVSGRSVSSAM